MIVADRTTGEQREYGTGGVQVIARAADILRALQRNPKGLSLSQLAREVDLARSTVHRIVSALTAEQFIAAASPSGRVRLGLGLAPLAAAASGDLRRELRPYLEQLYNDVNETVDLAVLSGDQVFFIDQIAAPHRLQAVSGVGVTFPIHCTANGKALLAELPTEAITQIVPERLDVFTPQTIRTRAQLLEELARVRAEGIAFDREEYTLGICAVGAVLPTRMGELVAITIPVPSIRFYGNEEKLVGALRSTVEQIRQRFEDLWG